MTLSSANLTVLDEWGYGMFIIEHDEDEFSALPKNNRGWTDPIVVHRRKGPEAGTLLLFVHGLGGRAHETWGNYPEFVFADNHDLDVGLLDYESGVRRRFWRSIEPAKHALALSHSIRDLHYSKVILVGHSMGGLLCKAAIKNLIDSRTHDNGGVLGVDKIGGLALFATPQSGSRKAPRVFSLVSKDARVLRTDSDFVSEIAQRFQDRVFTQMDWQTPTSRQRIPTFAVIATGDFWVDRLSAGLGLDTDQQKFVTGSHTSIVKPASRTDDAYVWFREKLEHCLTVPPMEQPPGVAPSGIPDDPTGDGAVSSSDRETLQKMLRTLLLSQIDVPMHINITFDESVDAFPVTEADSEKNEESA